jgi:hypothetical protein
VGQTKNTHEVPSRGSSSQLFPLHIDQRLGDAMPLFPVPSELEQSRVLTPFK